MPLLRQEVEGLQIGEGFETEVLEEGGGGAVEEGAPGEFAAPDGAHQGEFQEGSQGMVGGDAADRFDFGAADGLAVGDDGQRLQCGAGEALRRFGLQQGSDPRGGGRNGPQGEASVLFAEPQSQVGVTEGGGDIFQVDADFALGDGGELGGGGVFGRTFAHRLQGGVKVIGGQRFRSAEEQRADNGLKTFGIRKGGVIHGRKYNTITNYE